MLAVINFAPMKRHIIILLLAISIQTFGQESFKKEIDAIYNFHPHELSQEEQQKKFPALDTFFEKVKSDTTKYLPLLRQELQSSDHFPYFFYDGGQLLLMLSKSSTDKIISVDAFAKCNIKDLDPKIYVSLLSYLAGENINTTKAAIKILEDSTFHFYLIEHGAFDFIQGYSLMYCLLPLEPIIYVDTLIKIFQQTKSIAAQKSIITTLWFAYTCSGDKFLQSLTDANTLSKEVSEYSKRLLTDNKIDKDELKMYKNSNEEQLNEIRHSALTRFSDEAIDDLDFVTKSLRKKFNCR